jgi:predicted Rossmann fold nucleotide-binding protein DprA/Smf involved in DNA uptake
LIEIDYETLPDTIGIIGSRSFARRPKTDQYFRTQVEKFVSKTRPETIVVSGGAIGMDTYAEQAADKFARLFVPILPSKDLPIPQRFFERNIRLVEYVRRHEGMILAISDIAAWNGTRHALTAAKERDVPYLNIKVSTRPIHIIDMDRAYP